LTVLIGLRRYGLLGLNGCGKSTLLTAIGCRELPIPQHMDIYHLTREIEASDMSALQAVVSCDEERVKLEKEAEILAAQVSFLLAHNSAVANYQLMLNNVLT
jgi:ATP-binding cassette subfamily F protein 2